MTPDLATRHVRKIVHLNLRHVPLVDAAARGWPTASCESQRLKDLEPIAERLVESNSTSSTEIVPTNAPSPTSGIQESAFTSDLADIEP
jgi:hypothetical protein